MERVIGNGEPQSYSSILAQTSWFLETSRVILKILIKLRKHIVFLQENLHWLPLLCTFLSTLLVKCSFYCFQLGVEYISSDFNCI